MLGNNPKLDLVNINPYIKSEEILSIFFKIFRENEVLTSIKGHNSVFNLSRAITLFEMFQK